MRHDPAHAAVPYFVADNKGEFMPSRDYRDILGGGAIVIIGLFVVIYSMRTLSLGTVVNMGPGLFPATVGFILAGLGIGILAPALFRSAPAPKVDLRSFVAILASVLIFALMLRPFGLIPAIFALTFVASRADGKLSLLGTAALAASLSLGAVLIFQIGLGMQIQTISWP